MAQQNNAQLAMLKEIQELDFTVYELALYLDTHPWDTQAIEFYNHTAGESRDLKKVYVEKFTPLMIGDDSAEDIWSWGTSDFPWDM